MGNENFFEKKRIENEDKSDKAYTWTFDTNKECNLIEHSECKVMSEDLQAITKTQENIEKIAGAFNNYPLIQVQKNAQTMVEMSKRLQPFMDMQENVEKLTEAFTKHPLIQVQKNAQTMVEMSKRLQSFMDMQENIKKIVETFNNIDLSSIRDKVAEEITETSELLIKQEEGFWCLDIDILNVMGDKELTEEGLSDYIERNLETYIAEIVQDSMYELHITLIQETYEAYKGGFYKLCVMPLFAAFEHVFTSWYAGTINKDAVLVKQKPRVFKLYNEIKNKEYSEVEQEHLINVFVLSIIRTYKNTFIKIPDELCQKLNRNSIAHGFHDYDSITKVDILKLFQLLKATLILRSVSSHKFK
ncbi:hypothetical protein [Bacillus multifaciens]|uniref:hypothetical protein n=1 Tax=Bacillus multifaciens TaxID=3068506 RepID=UPI002741323F|nr:hypothetical protein [Bacillus sp. WLY-B-L8]MDP7979132.1 hypothetical protein [Bacillus sp. WLY-B-L8]